MNFGWIHYIVKGVLYRNGHSCFLLLKLSNVTANSVNFNQTPRSVASDRDLHCLQCPFYRTLGINGLI